MHIITDFSFVVLSLGAGAESFFHVPCIVIFPLRPVTIYVRLLGILTCNLSHFYCSIAMDGYLAFAVACRSASLGKLSAYPKRSLTTNLIPLILCSYRNWTHRLDCLVTLPPINAAAGRKAGQRAAAWRRQLTG